MTLRKIMKYLQSLFMAVVVSLVMYLVAWIMGIRYALAGPKKHQKFIVGFGKALQKAEGPKSDLQVAYERVVEDNERKRNKT